MKDFIIFETFNNINSGLGVTYCYESEEGIRAECYKNRLHPNKDTLIGFLEKNQNYAYECKTKEECIKAHNHWWMKDNTKTDYITMHNLKELIIDFKPNSTILINYLY